MPEPTTQSNAESDLTPIRLMFLCLARDCEETVPLFFDYLDRLEQQGFQCTTIVGENGSHDRTRTLIEQTANPRIHLLDTTSMAVGSGRLARMAIGRQALLENARSRRHEADYVCIVDLDNVMAVPPAPHAVKAAIQRLRAPDAPFAVGATSHPVFYDLLALRATGHDYTQLNAELAAAKKNPFTYYRFYKRRIYSNQKRIPLSEPIICISSFNGFCVYVAEDYFLGSYRAQDEADICEHVNFNLSIARLTGRQMLIAPELSILTPANHVETGFFSFWRDRLRKLPTINPRRS